MGIDLFRGRALRELRERCVELLFERPVAPDASLEILLDVVLGSSQRPA
jgi:hypothetical protein